MSKYLDTSKVTSTSKILLAMSYTKIYINRHIEIGYLTFIHGYRGTQKNLHMYTPNCFFKIISSLYLIVLNPTD